jgi:hypothetical protein
MESEISNFVHRSNLPVHILSLTNPVHTTRHPQYKIHLNAIRQPTSFLPSSHFPLAFLRKTYKRSSSLHSCCMPYPSNSSCLHHSNYTWRRLQVIKLLDMQLSPPCRHFVSPRFKYSPQHLVLKRPESMFLLTLIEKQKKSYCYILMH